MESILLTSCGLCSASSPSINWGCLSFILGILQLLFFHKVFNSFF